jgi:type IV secretory pathway VirB2 component (pilin)
MNCVKWAAIAGVVAVCVLLYLGKDDFRRMREMRQM